MQLTDAQWQAIEPYIPEEERRPPGKQGGRPWASARQVLDAVLWVLRTGTPWADMPRRFPPYQTCHRRFQRWVNESVLPKVLAALRRDLEKRGGIEDVRGLIDGTYVPAKKGGLRRQMPGWECDETHGNGRPPWSSTRCPYCRRKSIRQCAHRANSRHCFRAETAASIDRRQSLERLRTPKTIEGGARYRSHCPNESQ